MGSGEASGRGLADRWAQWASPPAARSTHAAGVHREGLDQTPPTHRKPPPDPHPGPPPCKGEGAEVYLRGEGTTCGREWEVDGGATRSDSAPVMPETG